MPNTLNYDPTTPEGNAIADLFDDVKAIEDADGSWDGADIVNLLTDWFTGLGINVKGPSNQAGPIKPTAISPDATAGEIVPLLLAVPDFTASGYPAGNPGFFYAQDDSDEHAEFTLLTFPTATPALKRAAIAELRRHGYAATEQEPTTNHGGAIRVQGHVLFPLPDGAGPVDRAVRVLYNAGFTRAASRPQAVVPSYVTPSPVSWRPGWIQIDVISKRGLGREPHEEATRAAAEAFAHCDWEVEMRGTDTFHVMDPRHAPA
ncbi:hypothetical protein [Streptomyces sp. NPDC058861]|uniref:hypothetical protein n=1 Tax=Streptomyces sp. NPDC058861 TaxID=3346653 RepID=UPI0036BBB8B9